MEIAFEHVLHYTNKKDVPIHEIAASLLATGEFKDIVAPVLEKLFPGLLVDRIDINLSRSAKTGSRDDEYIGTLLCKFQEDIEIGLTHIAKRTGVEVLHTSRRLISYVFLALILFGALYVYEQFIGPSAGTHIEGDYNTVINLTSDEIGATPEFVRNAIEAALNERERKRLGRNAISIVAPAKRESDATIVVAHDRSIELQVETISEIPSLAEFTDDDDVSEQVSGLTIDVRRSDRDERSVGWVGYVEIGDFAGRLKMILVPGIEPESLRELAHLGPIQADGEIFFRRGANGKLKPYVIHIYNVQGLGEPDSSSH